MTTQTLQLDWNNLPLYKKRRFVPAEFDFMDADALSGLFKVLIDRKIQSAKELEEALLDRSELEAALDQFGSVLYIRMTCQTDDPARAEGYRKFIEAIVPVIKPLNDQLNKRYLEDRKKFPLDKARYDVHDRMIKEEVELFREKNIPLQTELQLLSQEYQTICGAMTVQFKGKEHTLPQMKKYLLEADRGLREGAWRATTARRLKDKDRLDELFDKMLKLRTQVAANADCKNYCEYQFRAFQRFDYTPQDCKAFHKSAKEAIVPLLERMAARRAKDMKLESLRPWDMDVDPFNRPPLKPFTEVGRLIDGTKTIFNRLDKELGAQFTDMAERGLLDLENRKGKAPGGYQSTLSEMRKPFIFMNAVGLDNDVRTLLHEGGHAFHSLAAADEPILSYRHAPMEFCEVASMSMELLGGEYLSEFYKGEDLERSRTLHFEDIIQTLVWVATIDAFQHWIYENPGQDRRARARAWLDIRKQLGGNLINWTGLEEEHASLWHRQLHIFEVPFYYIEYGIAQLGALQLWLQGKKNFSGALANYRKALALGGSKPLPELFAAAGIKFDFSKNTIAPLVEAAARELKL